jgi:hypothetical protein
MPCIVLILGPWFSCTRSKFRWSNTFLSGFFLFLFMDFALNAGSLSFLSPECYWPSLLYEYPCVFDG